MAANTASNSVLASIFVLSMLLMFLIPFTLCVLLRFCPLLRAVRCTLTLASHA